MLGRINKRAARHKRAREAPAADEFGGFEIPGAPLFGSITPAPGDCHRGDGSFAVPAVAGGGAEEGVYWAYASFSEGVHAVRATGEDVGADVDANDSPVLVPAGTRARLHYPMRTHGRTRYMKYARVDADTGQFTLYHVPVYSEVDGGVCRYVEKFES